MHLQPAVDGEADHAVALLVVQRHAVVGNLDRLHAVALRLFAIGLHRLPALRREDVFEELATEEGLHVVALVERELAAEGLHVVEPGRPRDDLAEVDVRRGEVERVLQVLHRQAPVHHHGEAGMARLHGAATGRQRDHLEGACRHGWGTSRWNALR